MLSKPPILPVVSQIVEMKKSGVNHVGLCPFHREDTPSFFVFKERFKCFGCGEHGDVIDFVQKYNSVDFLEAIKILDMKIEKKDMDRIKKQQELINNFRTWEAGYFQECCLMERCCNKVLSGKLSWKQRELVYDRLNIYRYHADILQFGSDKEKYELYKDTNKTFDYRIDYGI